MGNQGRKKCIGYKEIIEKIKNNWIYTVITWFVFVIDMLIILFVVGTNKIGYAGIDYSFGIKDYINSIIWSCTVAFRVYFFAMLIGIVVIGVPVFIVMFKDKEMAKLRKYLVVNILFFVYFMGTQFVLHAKSGMYERYLLPLTIGFCLFWIVDLYQIVKNKQKLKTVFGVFIFVTMGAALFYTNIWDRGVAYAQEGKDITVLAENVAKYKDKNPSVVAALEYELDASISVYLEEEYGIKSVYNVYYNGYNDGGVQDGYLRETGRESILFEEADMYIGYSEKIEPLMEERKVAVGEYNRYDFGKFSMYVLKTIDNSSNAM